MNPKCGLCVATAMLALAAGSVRAGIFTSGNLVVMRVDNSAAGGSGAMFLDEYSRTGLSAGNTIALPTSGTNAMSTPRGMSHDRHLHLSPDGRFLTLMGYNAAPGSVDASTTSASSVARVVGIVMPSGTVDLSTKLTDSYDATYFRSAVTTDGSKIWLAGDNQDGNTTSGGLRFTTKGSSSTVNLSQVQVLGGSKTPDNVRDVGVYGGQLYDCSGSSSSIGKGVFTVGTGLPETGSQLATKFDPGSVSKSSFYMLDLDAGIAGVDTMYAAGDNLYKFVKNSGGTWVAAGSISFSASSGIFEHVIASKNDNGSISVFAGGAAGVVAFTDPSFSSSITGLATSTIISAGSGYSLGGIAFTPVPAPGAAALLVAGALVGSRRRR